MDPFFDVLPKTVLGAPYWPFVFCTAAAGVIGMTVLGQEDSPALFIVSGLIGWGSAHLYALVSDVSLWAGLFQWLSAQLSCGVYIIEVGSFYLFKILCFMLVCFLATMVAFIIFRGITANQSKH